MEKAENTKVTRSGQSLCMILVLLLIFVLALILGIVAVSTGNWSHDSSKGLSVGLFQFCAECLCNASDGLPRDVPTVSGVFIMLGLVLDVVICLVLSLDLCALCLSCGAMSVGISIAFATGSVIFLVAGMTSHAVIAELDPGWSWYVALVSAIMTLIGLCALILEMSRRSHQLFLNRPINGRPYRNNYVGDNPFDRYAEENSPSPDNRISSNDENGIEMSWGKENKPSGQTPPDYPEVYGLNKWLERNQKGRTNSFVEGQNISGPLYREGPSSMPMQTNMGQRGSQVWSTGMKESRYSGRPNSGVVRPTPNGHLGLSRYTREIMNNSHGLPRWDKRGAWHASEAFNFGF